MPESDSIPSNSSFTKDEYTKVSIFEALKISKWGLGLILKLDAFQTIVYIATSIIDNLQDLVYVYIFSRALNELIRVIQTPNASIEMLYPYLVVLLGYSFIQTSLSFINVYTSNTIHIRSYTFLKREMYKKLDTLGVQTLEQPEVNNKIYRANDYLFRIMSYIDESVDLLSYFVKMVSTLILIATSFPLPALMLVAVSAPYLFIDKTFRRNMYKFNFENTEGSRRAGGISSDLSHKVSLQEISTINAFNYFDKLYHDYRNWTDGFNVRMSHIRTSWSHGFAVLRDLIIFYGYLKIFGKFLLKQLNIGDVTFWMRTLGILEGTITTTIKNYNDLTEFAMQIKDTYLLFTTEPSVKDGTIDLPTLALGPKVEFKNVSFNYPNVEKLVIKNLDLVIKPGERLAIVGHNGAGKTTLVKLISRFYKTTNGGIFINDHNIDELKIDSLYKNMGTLFQDFNTYSHLTVKENICLGRPDDPPDEIAMRTAAQTADAMDFINEYPNKFDQMLGEHFKGGIRPSTGQWQKIAIARFFYRNSPLVIFDEPTASIDAQSEYNIFSNIYDFFEGKTVIIISHRFSTVRNADRIIVLDGGKIAEEGSHEELMKINGKYAEGFRLQAEGYTE